MRFATRRYFSEKRMDLSDAHTFSLSSQGSVYTQTVIQLVDGSSKLIVATLNRKVFCFDLSMTHCARPCGCVVSI
jgi:hypothetical protein